MINSSLILEYLKKNGYLFYSGVPCSILEGMLRRILSDDEIKYIPAVRENTALGVASGAHLAGRKACILIQNSGLGNIVNTLTSFNMIYRIPVLIFVTWRGYEGKDAPEHAIMGRKTTSILKELGVPYRILSNMYEEDIRWALREMEEKMIPAALIIKKGILI